MLTKSELNTVYNLLKRLGFKDYEKISELLISIFVGKNFWHYFGEKITDLNENDIQELINKVSEIALDFEEFRGVNYILSLIEEGHSYFVGTTYTYFLLPNEIVDKDFKFHMLRLPRNMLHLEEIIPNEIFLLTISDKLFGELLFADRQLLNIFRNHIEFLLFVGNNGTFIFLDNKKTNFYYSLDLFNVLLSMKTSGSSYTQFINIVNKVLDKNFNYINEINMPAELKQYYYKKCKNRKLPTVYYLAEKITVSSKLNFNVNISLNPVLIHHKFLKKDFNTPILVDYNIIEQIYSNEDSFKRFIAQKNYFFYIKEMNKSTLEQIIKYNNLNFLQGTSKISQQVKFNICISGIKKNVEYFVNENSCSETCDEICIISYLIKNCII